MEWQDQDTQDQEGVEWQDQDTQDQEKVCQDQEKDKIPRKISIAYPLGGEGFSSTPSARWALGVEFWEFSWHGAGVLLESPFSDCSAHQKKRMATETFH